MTIEQQYLQYESNGGSMTPEQWQNADLYDPSLDSTGKIDNLVEYITGLKGDAVAEREAAISANQYTLSTIHSLEIIGYEMVLSRIRILFNK